MSSPPALASSSSAAAQQLPPWRPHHRRLVPRPPACASRPSSILAHGASARYRSQPQPRLVARPTTRRSSCGDELLSVSYHLIIFSKQNSAEVGNSNKQIGKSSYRRSVWTLSSLKLSFLEINDLTSQLTNLRKRLAISRFGNEAITKGPQTAWPKQGNK
ncbi:unnamed protein product [Urochloa humidicola]